jgi:gliding motility-associated lipoprotein GldD
MLRYCTIILLCAALASCGPDAYTPKPAGYYLLEMPKRTGYQAFDKPEYPYSFEYPNFASIQKDTVFFGQKPENPYWINILIPSLNATIYLSYKEISPTQTLGKLLEDAHELSYFHTKKADYIDDRVFSNGHGVTGILYTVGGDAASAYQFIATDSVKHFIRGALYFDVSPNADSLKPANDFLRPDIQHLLETLRWK